MVPNGQHGRAASFVQGWDLCRLRCGLFTFSAEHHRLKAILPHVKACLRRDFYMESCSPQINQPLIEGVGSLGSVANHHFSRATPPFDAGQQ